MKLSFITRMGSKTNDIKFFKELLPLDIKIVVEPFGGSFAVIRDIYHDKKYKKIVNDTDPVMFYLYKNPTELKKAYEIWNAIEKKNISTKEKKEELMQTNLNEYLKQYIINSHIIRGSISHNKNLDKAKESIKFIKEINFTNEDAFITIEKFRKNKNAFIFLDPPYLFSDNSTYGDQKIDTDNTDFYLKFLDILKDKTTKAKIMLIINDLKILRVLYKDFLKKDYNKIYQLGKKKMKHLVITNY